MEKQTMGSLMAALRKAKGMTQQDVADRLAVSNKTISKWERNDGCPDISMLPAIAELYDITVDELLRGAVNADEKPQTAATQQRTEQQRRYLLESARVRFRNLSVLSLCLGILSPLAAIVIGFSFYRCYLALGAAVIFAAAALIVQVVAGNKYLFSLKSAKETDEPLQPYYKTLCTCVTLTVTAILLGLSLGIGGVIGCPDGYYYNDEAIKSPWPYLAWLVLSAVAFAVLRTAVGKKTQVVRRPLFSRRAKRIIAIGLAVLTVLVTGVPYLVYNYVSCDTYTFLNDAQREAFTQWQESGKSVALQNNKKQRTLYVYDTNQMVFHTKDTYAQEIDTPRDGEDQTTPMPVEPIDVYPMLADELNPALRVQGFEGGFAVLVLKFESEEDMQAYLDENLVDYADLMGMPIAIMHRIDRWNDTEIRFHSTSADYSIGTLLAAAAAVDAVWCLAWIIVGLVKRKHTEKTA